jgi:hypothetical protein
VIPVLRIHGVDVPTNDARALITDLMASDNPNAFAAAVRIRSHLEERGARGETLVALEPEHRDAVLSAIGDKPREGLSELHQTLIRDWEQRNFGDDHAG